MDLPPEDKLLAGLELVFQVGHVKPDQMEESAILPGNLPGHQRIVLFYIADLQNILHFPPDRSSVPFILLRELTGGHRVLKGIIRAGIETNQVPDGVNPRAGKILGRLRPDSLNLCQIRCLQHLFPPKTRLYRALSPLYQEII